MRTRVAAIAVVLSVMTGCEVPDPGPGEAAGIPPDPAAGYVVVPDLAYGAGPTERVDVHLPRSRSATPRPALLWLHGGAWMSSSPSALIGSAPYVLQLADHLGAVVVAVGFRLAPLRVAPTASGLRPAVRLAGITDGEVPIADQIADVSRAVHWLRTNARWFGIDPDRLVLLGDSSGAHLAALAAYAGTDWRPTGAPPGWRGRGVPGIRAVVTTALATDLRALMESDVDIVGVPLRHLVEDAVGCPESACDPTVLSSLDPGTWSGPESPPTWMIAGRLDDLAPPFHSERLRRDLLRVLPDSEVAVDLVDTGPPEWQTHNGIKLGMNLVALRLWLATRLV